MSRLLDFYTGNREGPRGLNFTEMLRMSYDEMEHRHDYIQWAFPLQEASACVPDSPVLVEEDRCVVELDVFTEHRQLLMLDRMLGFYGLWLRRDTLSVDKSPDFVSRAPVWLTPYNHNYLRITRILKSLVLFNNKMYARAFWGFLRTLRSDSNVGAETLDFWERAVV